MGSSVSGGVKIEFLPWYEPGAGMVRCGGDEGCGALLIEGDAPLHRRWHQRVEDTESLALRTANRINRPQDHTRVLGS